MSDYGLQLPVTPLGVIPGKGCLNTTLIDQFAANCASGANTVVGHLSKETYAVVPGDIMMGDRHDHTGYDLEFGVNSFSGYDGTQNGVAKTQRSFEEEFYFQGVVTTGCTLQNQASGYTTQRAGSLSVPNLCQKFICPGQLLEVQFPRVEKGTGQRGAAAGKPFFAPFDPTDFSTPVGGAYHAMTVSKTDGGILDESFEKTVPSISGGGGRSTLSPTQEDASGIKYGVWGIALTVIEHLIARGILSRTGGGNPNTPTKAERKNAAAECLSISKDVGLFSGGTGTASEPLNRVYLDILAEVLVGNLTPGSPGDAMANKAFLEAHEQTKRMVLSKQPSDSEMSYRLLRAAGFDMLFECITSSWLSKTEKIVGRSTSGAAPGALLDVVLGHCAV